MHVVSNLGLPATQAAVVGACTDFQAALSLESVPADKPLHKFSGLLVCSTAFARFRVTFSQDGDRIVVEMVRDTGSRYAVLQLFNRVKQRVEQWPEVSPFTFAPETLVWSTPPLPAFGGSNGVDFDGDGGADGSVAVAPVPEDNATVHAYYLTGITSQYEDVACECLAAFSAHVASVAAALDKESDAGGLSPLWAAAVYWPEGFAALTDRLLDVRCSRIAGALAAAALSGLLHMYRKTWPGKPALTLNPNLATVVAIALHRVCIDGHPIATGPAWERRVTQRHLLQTWLQVVELAAGTSGTGGPDETLRAEVLALAPAVQRAIRPLCVYGGPYAPLQPGAAAVRTALEALAAAAEAADKARNDDVAASAGPAGPVREKVMCSRIIHKRTDSRERFTANERYLRILRHSHPDAVGPPWPRPLSSPFPCDNCQRRFLGAPVFLVMKMLDGSLQEDGNFCSGPCANRYLDTFMRDGFLAERKANLLEYMQTVHGFKGSQLGMAPLWVEHQRHGGVLTDEAFDAIIGNPELTTTILQHPFIPTESVVEWKYVRDASSKATPNVAAAPPLAAAVPPPAAAAAAAPPPDASSEAPLSAPALDAVMGPPTLDIQRHQHWDVTDLQQPPLETIKRRLQNLPPLATFKSQWSVFLEQTAALGTTGVVPAIPAKKRARTVKQSAAAGGSSDGAGGPGGPGIPGGPSEPSGPSGPSGPAGPEPIATVEQPKPPPALAGLLTTRRTKKAAK